MSATRNASVAEKTSRKLWLSKCVEDVHARFGHGQELGEFAAKSYAETWGDLANTYGQERIGKALQRCLTECHFFPSVEDILKRMPAEEITRARCARCEDLEGWVYSAPGRVKRCDHSEAMA